MKRLIISNRYKRDARRLKRQGKTLDSLGTVVELLLNDALLPARYQDHALKGNWKGHRELHVEGDWLLIYKTTEDSIAVERTGSHAELLNR